MSSFLTLSVIVATCLQVESIVSKAPRVSEHGSRDPSRKLFFLFMANDHLPHADIWDRFFAQAERGVQYEVLLHCQDEAVCKKMDGTWGSHFNPELIPSVPSAYCTNLIDPMLALLKHALQKSPSAAAPNSDQFVFVSDTSVPIKPFWNVSAMLGGQSYEPPTRMCVEPWNVGKHAHNGSAILVKTSQWLTLGRRDSLKLLTQEYKYQKVINVATIGGQGCSDEFWFFAVLYGLLKPHYGETFEHALGQIDNFNEKCDTFVDWEHAFIDSNMPVPDKIPYGVPARPLITQMSDDELTPVMVQVRRGQWGPAEVREFSPETFKMWKDSPWAFLRKVVPNAVIKDKQAMTKGEAFGKYVFTSH